MLELLVEICLVDQGEVCAERLVPGICTQDRAEAWVAARPEAMLSAWRCAEAGKARVPLEMVEVAEGVFVHPGRHALPTAANAGDEANLGFIIGDTSIAVIDAGGARAIGEALYAAIRARSDLPVDWLVLTHMHPDHVFGASVFVDAGAEVIGHARLGDALQNRAESYAASLLRAVGAEVAMASDIVLPDASVAERREIDLGERPLLLEAQATAHTDNDLTVLDVKSGTWFLGDLVFTQRLPSMDGSVLGWLDVLGELAARPAERVVPGHGPAVLEWPEGAVPTRDYFTELVAETREALRDGESLSTASRTLGVDLRDGWQLFDEFNARNATAVYRELEWE